MSTYLSSFLNSTTSKYNNLKQQLTSSEADGSTEDDSHISRAMRAYYTEKGRPFPEWLPADPRGPPPVPATYSSPPGQQQNAPTGRWVRGGMSDLWDGPKVNQQQPQQADSLRLPRFGQQSSGQQAVSPAIRPGRLGDMFGDPQAGGRPESLECENRINVKPPSLPPSAGSGSSAKDMLKARFLAGNRSVSPVQSQGGYQPPGRSENPGPAGHTSGTNTYGTEVSVSSRESGGGRFLRPSYNATRRVGSHGGLVTGQNDTSSILGGKSDSHDGPGQQGSAGSRGYGITPFGGSSGGSVGLRRGHQRGRLGLPEGSSSQ